jgi:glutamine synthetase
MDNSLLDMYGENAFSLKVMRNYLSDAAFESLRDTMKLGKSLDASIADEVADAMKTWALEKGATHFTHWFQPLTGATAEKHDSFVVPDGEGGALLKFSGKELIQGEPDASSFPSGGLRATFEARGYTAWDSTSPAFIKEGPNGATLAIPTAFCGYNGEALDKKVPLLRSMEALDKQICRLGKFFGIESDSRSWTTLGAEQEYFLVDRDFYEQRLDLIQTGRTLFGRKPAKHQQLDDHYFGAIKTRVIEFMTDFDHELWRLGIPARTRHNEVCPAQFEIAPMFESLNLAVDHNMIMMEVMRNIAEEHGFMCLLHEKPYAGVNGSGKHNNWSVSGPDGKNWLQPGDNPHDNLKFMTLILALMKAVDTHADLLRASVATAGNDHRLGANEAPPAIISIFLGDQLFDVIEQLEKGAASSSKSGGSIEIDVSALPTLPRDATDRNRTSPLAFTGNKFEFRAVGSAQSCAGPNVVLNTAVAEALDSICTQIDSDVAAGKTFEAALQSVMSATAKKHKRILFNGDNYTDEWLVEAEKRGLPNLRKTPDALKAMMTDKSIALFGKYGVLSEVELKSRYEVYSESYEEQVAIEARCAITMAKTMIAPAALEYQAELAETIMTVESTGIGKLDETRLVLKDVCDETGKLLSGIRALDVCEQAGKPLETLAAMETLREAADALEGLVPDSIWPLPTYTEMLFMF